jgi:hypothetical protein
MSYTQKQIENAKRNYLNFLRKETANDYQVSVIGMQEAQRRADYHNAIVDRIKNGDKAEEKTWKLFFLNEEVRIDQKAAASKAKKEANKAASADILFPIKELRKIGQFGKWLNTKGNEYRSQHFSKKYTQEAVNSFLATL